MHIFLLEERVTKKTRQVKDSNLYCFLVCINKLGMSLDYDMVQTLLLAL